jgi:hypothetical protein
VSPPAKIRRGKRSSAEIASNDSRPTSRPPTPSPGRRPRAALAAWHDATDQVAAGRAVLRSAATTYRTHGPVLRALFWSAADDPDLAVVRRRLTAPIADVAQRIIARAMPATPPASARAMAEALGTMNIHCLLALRPDTSDADLDALVDTVATIWGRTILPHD